MCGEQRKVVISDHFPTKPEAFMKEI